MQPQILMPSSPPTPSLSDLFNRVIHSDTAVLNQFPAHPSPPAATESLQVQLVRTHHLCDSLSQWADPAHAAAFITDAASASSLMRMLNNALSTLGRALQDAGPTCQLRSCCSGCNTAYGCGQEVSATMPQILEPYTHVAVCLLSLCLSLMRWQHAAMEQAQDALLALFVSATETMQYDPTDESIPRISPHIAPRGSMPINTVILTVGLVDNCSIGAPHAALLAASLISFIVARRPASCFSLLDPQPAVAAVCQLLRDIFDRVKDPHCLVEECFGTVQVILIF